MPPKGTSRHRTPKKADAKGNAGWLACDGSSRLLCEVEDAYVEPGVRICGVLQLADEGRELLLNGNYYFHNFPQRH